MPVVTVYKCLFSIPLESLLAVFSLSLSLFLSLSNRRGQSFKYIRSKVLFIKISKGIFMAFEGKATKKIKNCCFETHHADPDPELRALLVPLESEIV